MTLWCYLQTTSVTYILLKQLHYSFTTFAETGLRYEATDISYFSYCHLSDGLVCREADRKGVYIAHSLLFLIFITASMAVMVEFQLLDQTAHFHCQPFIFSVCVCVCVCTVSEMPPCPPQCWWGLDNASWWTPTSSSSFPSLISMNTTHTTEQENRRDRQ